MQANRISAYGVDPAKIVYLSNRCVFKKNAMFLFMNISKSQRKVRFTMRFQGEWKLLNGKFT
jgi:hypothetical protein